VARRGGKEGGKIRGGGEEGSALKFNNPKELEFLKERGKEKRS